MGKSLRYSEDTELQGCIVLIGFSSSSEGRIVEVIAEPFGLEEPFGKFQSKAAKALDSVTEDGTLSKENEVGGKMVDEFVAEVEDEAVEVL